MPDLRQQTCDLYDVVEELETEDIPEKKQEKRDFEEDIAAEYDAVEDVPTDKRQQFERYKQELRELHGTLESIRHYADAWGEGDTCEFVLEELNGDEYAKVVDSVSAEAAKQARQDGSLPEGLGMIKSLEYGVVDIPPNAPANPGEWPAAVVGQLFETLENITAPEGVDLGNESLQSVMQGTASEAEADADLTPSEPMTEVGPPGE